MRTKEGRRCGRPTSVARRGLASLSGPSTLPGLRDRTQNRGMAVDDDGGGVIPTLEQARDLAAEILGDQGTRLAHVLTAGRIAHTVGGTLATAGVLDRADSHLLEVAATVHDIGYAPALRVTGFHPLDGGLHLIALGWSARLANLVANHSCALLTAPDSVRAELTSRFPAEPGLLPDALAYSDMHSSPSGEVISTEDRLADVAIRHPDPRQETRARELRVAIARVGVAMLSATTRFAEEHEQLDPPSRQADAAAY